MNNDIISREALIKWIDDSVSKYGHIYSTDTLDMWGLFKDYLINFAPTVDITEEQAIDKLHETGWLPKHDKEMTERPQGEWIEENSETGALGIKYTWFKCNQCGWNNSLVIPRNFCPNCGADMRGGKE